MLRPNDDDPVMAELRQIREEMLAAVDYDLKRWNEELMRSQAQHKGKMVSFDHKDPNRTRPEET